MFTLVAARLSWFAWSPNHFLSYLGRQPEVFCLPGPKSEYLHSLIPRPFRVTQRLSSICAYSQVV